MVAGLSVARAGEETAKPNSQDDFWSHVKDMRAGPVTFDLDGQARLRYEYDDGLSIKGYEPGGHDQLLLERIRLDLSARFWDRPRLFLQLQDAHPFLTKLGRADFPTSSPIEDTLDIRQLYAEWLKIGDSPFGFRIGRQQIAYGDQRVFGPGNWGNTGRFAWDAAMCKLDTAWLVTDLWVGKYLTYQTDVWPDRPVENFLTFVNYTQFLIEGVVVTILGGLIGIALGTGAVIVLRSATEMPVALSWLAFAAGLVVTILVGVVASLLPARRAASTDVVNALRP